MIKKYNNLQEWLESGEAEDYNLIADTQDEQDEVFGMIENPYEKFFVYKYITEFQNDSIWEKLEEIKKVLKKKLICIKVSMILILTVNRFKRFISCCGKMWQSNLL